MSEDVIPFPIDPIKDALHQVLAESYELKPIPLPWPRLSKASKFLRPGLSILGGAPGCGKSFFSLALGLACQQARVRWVYLPLESDRAFFIRRMAAMIDGRFDALLDPEDTPNATERACNAIHRATQQLEGFALSIHENPNLPGPDGQSLSVGPADVLDWTRASFRSGCRVAIVDPLAMIDFGGGRNQWAVENAFIRDLNSLAQAEQATVVLAVHTVKRIEGRLLELGDLQGGAQIGRTATSVVMVQAHEPKDSIVYRVGGCTATVWHNRTVTVLKSRNSAGGPPIAFDFGKAGPVYQELGVIAPRDRARMQQMERIA